MVKHKIILSLLSLSLVLFVTMTGQPTALAQDYAGEDLPPGVSGDDVFRVANQIYCEVCEGVPVSACPSVTCQRWRQEIANLLGEGRSDEEILIYFAERYGDEVTGVPLHGNQRSLALLFPVLVVLLIGVAIGYQVWRMRERGETQAQQAARAAGLQDSYDRPVPDNVDPDYLERLLRLL